MYFHKKNVLHLFYFFNFFFLSITYSKKEVCFYFFCLRGRRLNFSVCSVREGLSKKESQSLTGETGEEAVCKIGLGGNRTLERPKDL